MRRSEEPPEQPPEAQKCSCNKDWCHEVRLKHPHGYKSLSFPQGGSLDLFAQWRSKLGHTGVWASASRKGGGGIGVPSLETQEMFSRNVRLRAAITHFAPGDLIESQRGYTLAEHGHGISDSTNGRVHRPWPSQEKVNAEQAVFRFQAGGGRRGTAVRWLRFRGGGQGPVPTPAAAALRSLARSW